MRPTNCTRWWSIKHCYQVAGMWLNFFALHDCIQQFALLLGRDRGIFPNTL